MSYEFTFPDDVSRAQSDHFGSIYLKTRFKIDNPQGSPRAGYGEVNEMTFGMPVPAGAANSPGVCGCATKVTGSRWRPPRLS